MLYIALSVLSLQHTSIGFAMTIALQTILPMLIWTCIVQYILIPNFLLRHRTILYYVCSFILLIIICLVLTKYDRLIYNSLMQYGYEPPKNVVEKIKNNPNLHDIHGLLKNTFLLMTTFTVTTVNFLSSEKKELEQRMKEEKLYAEIRYLKAQINPHFLFNALNNIYSLAYTKDERTPHCVLQLSEMLRFVIDDSQNDSVPLSKELQYIENYIDFQRIRFEHNLNISLETEIENHNFPILPMIFQPLVENCFKHSGISSDSQAYINIHIKQFDNCLTFIADNSIPNNKVSTQDSERIGIGIANVKKRLKLHFGEKAKLEIHNSSNAFRTILNINKG